jgi:hypothetical protein
MSYDISLHNPLPPGEIRAHGQFGPWNANEPGETPVAGEYTFQDAENDLPGTNGVLALHQDMTWSHFRDMASSAMVLAKVGPFNCN